MVHRRALIAACVTLVSLTGLGADRAVTTQYDPLVTTLERRPEPLRLDVRDQARQRTIPLLVYMPTAPSEAPVVLFSHGLGGSRDGSAFLGTHWAARGYVAVFLQHPGSDESIWKDVPLLRRMGALQRAANAENFLLRAQDVTAVLNQLARWQVEVGHVLRNGLDLARLGMSGHSFGAMTTQAVSGEFVPGHQRRLTDRRIIAALPMSPSAPRLGDPGRAFGQVSIPWLLMTGTRDEVAIGGATIESRLQVFPALPPGDKYELVLFDAQHSAFTDRPLPGERLDRNPNHHVAIRAVSTAFWDAHLRKDMAARAWLDGDGPRRVLEPRDRWQKK